VRHGVESAQRRRSNLATNAAKITPHVILHLMQDPVGDSAHLAMKTHWIPGQARDDKWDAFSWAEGMASR